MQPFETIPIDSMIAACNGGGGPLGHPKVYLNLAADGRVECPYCSRLFVYRGPHDPARGHYAETPSATAPHEQRGPDHPPPSAPAVPDPVLPPAAPISAAATSTASSPAKP
jgi:uncharacterized Zn-finger protein